MDASDIDMHLSMANDRTLQSYLFTFILLNVLKPELKTSPDEIQQYSSKVNELIALRGIGTDNFEEKANAFYQKHTQEINQYYQESKEDITDFGYFTQFASSLLTVPKFSVDSYDFMNVPINSKYYQAPQEAPQELDFTKFTKENMMNDEFLMTFCQGFNDFTVFYYFTILNLLRTRLDQSKLEDDSFVELNFNYVALYGMFAQGAMSRFPNGLVIMELIRNDKVFKEIMRGHLGTELAPYVAKLNNNQDLTVEDFSAVFAIFKKPNNYGAILNWALHLASLSPKQASAMIGSENLEVNNAVAFSCGFY
jgi:hypothetical protein